MQNYKPISGRRIRFATVGCGRIWKNHVESLKKHAANAEIVAVCDIDEKALEAAEGATGAQGYLRYEDMLAKSDADVVVLATPSGLHAAQTIRAAQAGKPVITEKPMATRWQDGKRMVAACDQAGVRLTAEAVGAYDVVLLATDHDAFDYKLIARHARLIVDTRGVYLDAAPNVVKA